MEPLGLPLSCSACASLGYIENRTVAIDYRWTEGGNDRYAAMAADVIVALGTPAIVEAKKAASEVRSTEPNKAAGMLGGDHSRRLPRVAFLLFRRRRLPSSRERRAHPTGAIIAP
jgi:hypothetical protein